MAQVECDIEEALIEHNGKSVDGLCATCGRCEHSVEVPGYDTDENRRKLKHKLRNECPEKQNHHYVFPEGERCEVAMKTTEE